MLDVHGPLAKSWGRLSKLLLVCRQSDVQSGPICTDIHVLITYGSVETDFFLMIIICTSPFLCVSAYGFSVFSENQDLGDRLMSVTICLGANSVLIFNTDKRNTDTRSLRGM